MKVMFVCHHYRPEVGAPQRRWETFVREWRSSGHDVTVLTSLPHYPTGRLLPGHSAAELLGVSVGEHGEQVIRVPFLPVGRRGGIAKLGDQGFVAVNSLLFAPNANRPDVVVSSIPGPATLATADALSALYQVPHVLELRDAWPDLLYEGSPDDVRIPRWFGRWMTRRQRAADAVVSVTRSFADVLVARGVHPRRVHHVSNGIDVRAVPTLPAPDAHGGPLRVLYLGTHGVSQGLENAVEALAGLTGTAEARFVGDGTEKDKLRQLASDLDAPITFLDPVHGDNLWEQYHWADTCLVHLAPWPAFAHTVPSKLYEIMALGRRVTAVIAGEAARIVEESGAGLLVEPGDPQALNQALRSLSGARQPAPAAPTPRAWVEKNADLRGLAHRFLDILESVAVTCV